MTSELAMAARLAGFGPVPMAPERAPFHAFTDEETARWPRVVLASGARPE